MELTCLFWMEFLDGTFGWNFKHNFLDGMLNTKISNYFGWNIFGWNFLDGIFDKKFHPLFHRMERVTLDGIFPSKIPSGNIPSK